MSGEAPVRPAMGILEWFHLGDKAHVERVVSELAAMGVQHLRTGFSWADWHVPEGPAWFDWLLSTLSAELEVVPCFTYTPPSLGVLERTSSPPREPQRFTDFVGEMVDRYGDHFEWVELWNEPNNISEWDWTLDPEWTIFTEMVGATAARVREQGKHTLLGGMSPIDPNWLGLLKQRGALDAFDAVGVHGFPGTWESSWKGWPVELSRVRQVLGPESDTEVWITEVGYSTWRHDEIHQLDALLSALRQDVHRVYWYSLEDLHPERSAVSGFHQDEREYHFGMRDWRGRPKLLRHLVSEHGFERLTDASWLLSTPSRNGSDGERVLITGGAGFVGTNLAHALLQEGRPVLLLDNLSRGGSYGNLRWLRERHGKSLDLLIADVRDPLAVRRAVSLSGAIVHLAGQVAVTTSLEDPRLDFDVNTLGTIHLLEELRRAGGDKPLVFASTNKVYGALDGLPLERRGERYVPVDPLVARDGIDEDQPLDLQSPYGCSKGAADQYVVDHARMYGMPLTVYRMSCIYGPHQFGTEDQGWIAHFTSAFLRGEEISVYGDGRQVRDALHVDDLVDAFRAFLDAPDRLAGRAYNVGGGPSNATSVVEVLASLRRLTRTEVPIRRGEWRQGDQRYYVSNTNALEKRTGWRPRVDLEAGLARLVAWRRSHPRPCAARTRALRTPPGANPVTGVVR